MKQRGRNSRALDGCSRYVCIIYVAYRSVHIGGYAREMHAR